MKKWNLFRLPQKILEDMQRMKQSIMEQKEESQQKCMTQLTEKKEAPECRIAAASGPMNAPIQLVENKNNQLSVNPQAMEILNNISQPVVVVSVVGRDCTGKSYLMNCLAGQNQGVSLGSTTQSETKGIWMWCVPHPTEPNHTLVLLDTEGLGDVEKGDPKNDAWIFALAVLLSSTFVYNSMSSINNDALEKLHFVTELIQLIRAKSSPRPDGIEDACEFVSSFRDFVWTAWNFTLEVKVDGYSITDDEYLENVLTLISGKKTQIQASNQPKECNSQFLPRRKCFVYNWPVCDPELLATIENNPENQLNPKFQKQLKSFCSHIFTFSSTKKLREGIMITGKRLGTLVETYVGAVNSEAVLCLGDTMTTLAQRENSMAVRKAADHYSEQMAQRVRLSTDTLQELLNLHTACEKEAIALFMEHSFGDEKREFKNILVVTIGKRKKDFLLQNETASLTCCQAEMQKLSEPLKESVSRGDFSVPGGHSLYLEAKRKVEQDYERVPRKGVKANEVPQDFPKSEAIIEDTILQSDRALTDRPKAMAGDKAKKEGTQKEQKMLRKKEKEQDKFLQAQKRSFRENIAQTQEKMEGERKDLLKEQERTLEHKMNANEMLQDFPKSQAIIEDTTLRSDRALAERPLTDRPKAMAGDKAKKKGTQKEQKMLRKKEKEQDKVLQTQKRSFKENIAQIQEKTEGERKDLLREQESTLEQNMNITMASQPIMSTPVCLIENKNKQLLVNQEALRTLSGISQPVVVVAMVGMCRTGKSYLLNRLTGEQYGFPLGSTVQSETKGIWMWCVPHPTKPDHTLVLLDTEGLGDVEKGDSDNDSWIFALAVLLSSTLIYNSMGTINSDAVDKLHYVAELTNLIRLRSSPNPRRVEDSAFFVSFFPAFVWTVRDFTLELKVNGRPITEDEYLENSLKLIPGNNPRVESSNKTRECIKHFFPKRKCFTFDRPAHEKELLSHIEDLREEQLNPNFLEQLKSFCSYILNNAITKTLGEGAKVTGKHLGTLVTTYVDAIMSGVVPCLEDAVTALAQRENSMAMQKATDHYSEQMTQRVRLPTDSVQELLDLHGACKREAISIFMEHSFKDEKQEFKRKLGEAIKKKKIEFLRQNEESSSRYCQKLIEQLSKPLMERVSAGSFFVPGGYQLYKEAKEKVVHDYEEAPRKGVMASEVLQDFHKSQEPVMDAIIHVDLLTAEQTKNETVLKELLREKLENEQKWKEYAKMRMGEDPESLKKEREVMLNALVDVLYFLMKMLQDKGIQTDEVLKKLNSKIDELLKKMESNFFSKEFLGTLIKDIILSIICPKIQKFMGSFFS